MYALIPFLLLILNTVLADPPKYIWNLGLAMTCDVTPFKNGLPDEYQTTPCHESIYPENYIKNVKEGDIVWLQTHQVARFYQKVLPTINSRFFLYINDGDRTFPASYRRLFNVDMLIQDPRVIHIFGQNVDYKEPDKKVSGIPIGLDFHTIANSSKCALFCESRQSVEEQAKQLDELLQTLPPTRQRLKRAFVDFQLHNYSQRRGENRLSIFKQVLQSGLIDYSKERIPRRELWETKGKYAFSISPHGLGLDCHRTWEDLVLGCIVIVKSSPLDPLYEGLPVVIVNSWSEVNEQNFDKWLKQYGDAFTNPNYRKRLTHRYWMNVMRMKQREYLSGPKR
jgi:hypothetical protein